MKSEIASTSSSPEKNEPERAEEEEKPYQHNMSQLGTPHMKGDRLDSSSVVSDGRATSAKQLLNAYIYDFLVKSRLPQTAKLFVNEADVPSTFDASASTQNSPHMNNGNNNGKPPLSPGLQQFFRDHQLPVLRVTIDAPQGFLFEWWQVFWDVYQAKNNRGSSQLANQYYQLQLMKQRQQQDLQSLSFNRQQPNMLPTNGPGQYNNYPNQPQPQQPHPQPQQQPQPSQPQQRQQPQDPQQQQRLMMQLMMKQQQQQQGFNQMDPHQQQLVLANMSGNNPNSLSVQQQMFLLQQSQLGLNRFQQHAQNQMNHLRQQAQAAGRQGENGSPQREQSQPDLSGQLPAASGPNNGPPQGPQGGLPHGQRPPSGPPGQPGMNGVPYPQQPNMINSRPGSQAPTPFQQPGPNPQGQLGPTPQGQPGPTPQGQSGPGGPGGMRMNSVGNGKVDENANGMPQSNNRNINALQDYQMQLMLLEKQNKKRLDIARNSGSADPNALASLTAGMLPPQQQQMQQMQQSQQQISQQPQPQVQVQSQVQSQPSSVGQTPQSNPSKPSPALGLGPGPSPIIGNKPSPGGTKKKKETSKRGRKPSVTSQNGTNNNNNNNNNSSNGTPSNSAATPSHLKKEFSTPLTPTSETPNESGPAKRKRKGSTIGDSPKKPANNKNSKKDNINFNTDTIKEEKEDISNDKKLGGDDTLNAMAPPSAMSSNFQDIDSHDQMFSMDVLDHGSDHQLFDNSNGNSAGPTAANGNSNGNMNLNMNMSNGANGGLDDIDFDFNLFLDGNVNDGMNAFNWNGVDALEGNNS